MPVDAIHVALKRDPGVGIPQPVVIRLVGHPSHGRPGDAAQIDERIADLNATGMSVEEALASVYSNIRKITCPGSYYRTDIGKTLWPPSFV